jgi:hypothetical protein
MVNLTPIYNDTAHPSSKWSGPLDWLGSCCSAFSRRVVSLVSHNNQPRDSETSDCDRLFDTNQATIVSTTSGRTFSNLPGFGSARSFGSGLSVSRRDRPP